MKLSDLKAKGADKLSEEEIAVLRNNQDKLSDEDKEFFADVLKEPEGLEEEGLTFESPEALDKWLEDREQKKQEALKAEEELKKAQEEGQFGEDEFFRREKILQELVDKKVAEVEQLGKLKEEELTQI